MQGFQTHIFLFFDNFSGSPMGGQLWKLVRFPCCWVSKLVSQDAWPSKFFRSYVRPPPSSFVRSYVCPPSELVGSFVRMYVPLLFLVVGYHGHVSILSENLSKIFLKFSILFLCKIQGFWSKSSCRQNRRSQSQPAGLEQGAQERAEVLVFIKLYNFWYYNGIYIKLVFLWLDKLFLPE